MTTPKLTDPLPAEMQSRLEVALTALLDAGNPEPLRAFVIKEREHAPAEYPDVWRHAAAYLFKCDPTAVTAKMRLAVKHACSYLIGHSFPDPANAPLTDLLKVLGRE